MVMWLLIEVRQTLIIVFIFKGNIFSGLEDAIFARAEVLAADYTGKNQFKPEPSSSYYPPSGAHYQQAAPVPPPGLFFFDSILW